MQPYLLYSDGQGNIFEDTTLYAIGRSGWDAMPVPEDSWIALPDGGNLYELPGRIGIGIDVQSGELRLCNKGIAVAAYIPPAYTGLYISPYETQADAPTLPLFCYTAAGWHNNEFYVTAILIEQDIRQKASGFVEEDIQQGVEQFTKAYPHNRLVQHLANNCCNTYHCPAARNYFMGRWECPIPSSPACNANCIGCISFQPQDETIESPQDRLTFKPTADEIVEYTVPHLQQAPYPIVSFGQGCEGEPLLMWETIKESIVAIRKHTNRGSININTNASNPKAVEQLMQAGLNSIRISLNSTRKPIYTAYYRPNNYEFEHLAECAKVVRAHNGWVSLNYFVFPGMTDSEAEIESLIAFIKDTDINMIQWRNFNIDPDWYLGKLGIQDCGPCYGIKNMMAIIKEECPTVKFGYFNPPAERMVNYDIDFAH
jgi:pyruvate-formate lyase-activating enzyme